MKHTIKMLQQHVCDTLEQKTRSGGMLDMQDIMTLLPCVELANGLCKMEKYKMKEHEMGEDMENEMETMSARRSKPMSTPKYRMKTGEGHEEDDEDDTRKEGKSYFGG